MNNSLTEITRRIRAVSYALNNVEVKGRENMDILLGSIQEIDRLAALIEKIDKEMNSPDQKPQFVLEEVKAE